MKKRILSFIIVAIMTMTLFSYSVPATGAAPVGGDVATFDPVNGFMVNQHALFDEPDMFYKPGSRWWLAEGLNVDETIIKNVKIMYEMGLSQIEIVCMPEEAVDAGYQVDNLDLTKWPAGTTSRQIYSWGTEEWNHDTELIIREATKYGMGFSMTSGTHWANANLPDWYMMPDDDAAGKSLQYRVNVVQAGQTFDAVLPRSSKSGVGVVRQDLSRVVAIKVDPSSTATVNASGQISGTVVYAEQKGVDLTDLVKTGGLPVDRNAGLDEPASMKDSTGAKQFTLNWTAPDDGTYYVIAFWMQATGQSPTPSPSRNYTITYIDKAGMDRFIQYYKEVVFADPELVELVKQNGKGEMYMDSLEISSTNGFGFWGYTFYDLFEENRGYDLTPYLPFMIKSGSGRGASFPSRLAGSNGSFEAKVHHDLFETMNDCYRDNVLKPLKEYLNDEMNMKLRAEITYGVNYEISTPAQYVDYSETESLEYKNCLDSFRGQAGAAHIWDLRLSSETGAGNPNNYVFGQDRYMQIMNTQFASGISFTVFHGYSAEEGADPAYTNNANYYTPTYWPGHEGMYARHAERWGPRQPAFQQYDDYMPMIARCQAILQQGIPQIDIGILHTDYNHNNSGAATASSDPLLGLPAGTFDPTRDNRGLYWQDMSLQNNGYTYDYFAPDNLYNIKETGITMYGDSTLLPSRVGYQALIIYQDALSIKSAEVLLELAQAGLPILLVNNAYADRINNNTVVPANNTGTNNTGLIKAASRTLSLSESDADLLAIVGQMEALPNVRRINGPAFNGAEYYPSQPYDSAVYRALLDLGVRPRTELTGGIKNIYTVMRKTDDTDYVFTYNANDYYDYNGRIMAPLTSGHVTFPISIDSVGKPYMIDPWTGNITEVAVYTIADGRTSFEVSLKPGATAYFALDKNDAGNSLHAITSDAYKVVLDNGQLYAYATESGSYTTILSDGSEVQCKIAAPANIALGNWSLTVDSYTNGPKTVKTEDRGKGYLTKEAWYPTVHTLLGPVTLPTLKPWKDIPEIGAGISGVGYYTTTFTLPADWDAKTQGAYLEIEDINGNLAQVFVNGLKNSDVKPINTDSSISFAKAGKADGFDFLARYHDVSALLKPGLNTITVSVSSTMENVLRYLGQVNGATYPALNTAWTNRNAYKDPATSASNPWQSYGMVGEVKLVTFGVAAVKPNVLAEISADNASGIVNTPASYTVALTNVKGVGSVELSFMFDGEILDKDSIALTPQSGFVIDLLNPAPVFQYVDQGIWKCTAKFMYMGFVGADGPLDVVKISGTAIKTGPATVTITGFAASGDNGDGVGPIPSQILTAAATVTVGGKQPVYSKYDLNKDGSIDETDLLYLIYFYQWNDRDPGWATDGLYNVFAKDCDFQVNGKVDLADMIELTANYGVYDPYA